MGMKYYSDSLFSHFLSDFMDALGCENANNCATAVEDIFTQICTEAYSRTGHLYPNSMLQCINATLAEEYDFFHEKIEEVIRSQNSNKEEEKKAYEKLLPYCSAVVPTKLIDSESEFENWIDRFINRFTGRWNYWLKGKRPKRFFDLIQLLLYGLLHPKNPNEEEEQRNERIGQFYRKLLAAYLGFTEPPEESIFRNHCKFTWSFDTNSKISLTEGTVGLISTTLFLSNLLIHADPGMTDWTEEDQNFITRFKDTIIERINKSNHYIRSFYEIQSPAVFLARPHITEAGKKQNPSKPFSPPSQIPWEGMDFTHPVGIWIQSPAASGKTALYQAISQALTGDHEKDLALASQLKLDRKAPWVVIGMNAQQYIWYWNEYGEKECLDLTEMFFKGNLLQKKTAPDILDSVMKHIVPKRVQDAYQNRRLILLLDGFDELPGYRKDTFYEAVKRFMERYPNAHRILFTRPFTKKENARFCQFFPESVTLPPWQEHGPQQGRHNAIPTTPLMCQLPKEDNLPHLLYGYAKQVLLKDYDYAGRCILLPDKLPEKDLEGLAIRLAWNRSANSNSSIFHELQVFMDLPEADSNDRQQSKKNIQDVHDLAQQIGVLIPDKDGDYQFISPLMQAVLAAAYLKELLHAHVPPTLLRNTLLSLPDALFQDICFASIHLLTQTDPIFAEVLLGDYLLRNWDENHAPLAIQDIEDMKQGRYGHTPFQISQAPTLHRMYSTIIASSSQ